MTAPKELHEKIDQLSPEGMKALREFLDRQVYVERQMAALYAFAEGWTPEEEAAFESAMNRRMTWRSEERS